jgi:hypothetical protein
LAHLLASDERSYGWKRTELTGIKRIYRPIDLDGTGCDVSSVVPQCDLLSNSSGQNASFSSSVVRLSY